MSEQPEIKNLITRFEALETRHRAMVVGSIAVVLLVLFDFTWYQPQLDKQKKLNRELAVIEKERSDLLNANEQLQQQLTGAAFNQKRQKLSVLSKQSELIDQSLAQYAQLVSPRQMPGLLKDFFSKSATLELLKLEKHDVRPAFKNKTDEALNTQEAQVKTVQLYRHDFTVTLRGRYFELLKSLKDLEAMNIRIYWEGLNYRVDEYPLADIEVTVYTFSYDKRWIGA